MLLESLEAQTFRNLRGSIAFSNGMNILVGENGQGKTNWLEAIAVLASTRSFRTTRLQDAWTTLPTNLVEIGTRFPRRTGITPSAPAEMSERRA